MATISVKASKIIGASADELWKIVGEDFASVHAWATDVQGARATGKQPGPDGAPCGGRSCSLDGFGETDETLIAFDTTERSLAYTVTAKKLPSFVREMRNDWTVEHADAGTARVTAHVTAEASGLLGTITAPMMRMKLRSTMGRILTDLQIFAETGNVSPAKAKKLAKSSS